MITTFRSWAAILWRRSYSAGSHHCLNSSRRWGRRGRMTYFGRVGTWWSGRHWGHGAVVFNGMYFRAEYGFLEDLTACLLLIWVGDNLVLASRHRRGRRSRRRMWWRLLWRRRRRRRMELSTVPLSVFVPTRPSFALRVDFSAACKQKKNTLSTACISIQAVHNTVHVHCSGFSSIIINFLGFFFTKSLFRYICYDPLSRLPR